MTTSILYLHSEGEPVFWKPIRSANAQTQHDPRNSDTSRTTGEVPPPTAIPGLIGTPVTQGTQKPCSTSATSSFRMEPVAVSRASALDLHPFRDTPRYSLTP